MTNKLKRNNLPIILLRLIVPFTIFFHPFLGGLASLLADDLDVVLIDIFNLQKFRNYPKADKILDVYYLFLEWLAACLFFDTAVASIATLLFFYRLLGTVLFLFTGVRKFLFYFANVFEYYFLFYSFFFYLLQFKLSLPQQIILILILLPFKLLQEYILHVRQYKPWEYIRKRWLSLT